MAELYMRYPDFKTKVLTLSFDDGTTFDRQMVPILNKYGIKCTFNLNSKYFYTDKNAYRLRIKPDEVKDLYVGHEIAAHTYSHPHLENLDDSLIVSEVIKDREILEKLSGKMVKGMAYPSGLKEERVVDAVRYCGIAYARTTKITHDFNLPADFLKWNPTCHWMDNYLDGLLEKFLEPDDTENTWRITNKVFYIWGHSYEFENRFDDLEDLCKKLSGKDTVWYATNIEVYNYIKNYRRLEFSADGNMIYNPTAIDIYAFANGKNVLIPSGKTVEIKED